MKIIPLAQWSTRQSAIACLATILLGATTHADPNIIVTMSQPVPCNVFDAAGPVTYPISIKASFSGPARLTLRLLDHHGRPVQEESADVTLTQGANVTKPHNFGSLPPGYYELTAIVSATTQAGETVTAEAGRSLGVAPFVSRTAEEARRQGLRFGIKTWQLGRPGVWWRRPLVWRQAELLKVCEQLGLNWTRHLFNQQPSDEPGVLGVLEVVQDYELNTVLKIESIPAAAYDAQRYGPKEDFSKNWDGRPWSKASLPLEQPYKQWLREQLAQLPPEQTVFELWNEPWQWFRTMPGEDFAKLCAWTVEVVHEVRPGAVVGPNCGLRDGKHCSVKSGSTYGQDILRAGGFDTVDMICIHPYTASTPEHKNFRAHLRNDHDYIRHTLGRDLDLYATEYGWSTAPEGERSVSERQQAQYMVRESLMLYAEDVKTLIPHTLGQREHDPRDREHWFGFFRINMDPKPAIIAHATCARMIDGSRFAGDLWYGPGVGAMLFERGGEYTLALWTEGEEKTVEIDTHAQELTRVDLMGRSSTVETDQGRLTLKLDGDVVYLTGVGAQLEQLAARPGSRLNDERWGAPRAGRLEVPQRNQEIVVDGQLEDWQGVPATSQRVENVDDLAASWRFAWDSTALYAVITVQDKKLVNPNTWDRLHMADAVDLRLCGRPERQVGDEDLYDFTFIIAPTSQSGSPGLVVENLLSGRLVNPTPAEARGLQWSVGREERSWNVELKIPFVLLHGAEPKPGAELAYNLIVFDRDREDKDEWAQWWKRLEVFSKKRPPAERPLLVLEE